MWQVYALARTAGELKYCKSSGVFIKTLICIPLALVIVIANSALSTISYPTRAHGIMVK